MKLIFKVENQKITRIDEKEVVADSKNYLYAKFVFSHDWGKLGKTAVFKRDNDVYHVLLEDDSCKIPHEVIKEGSFSVSVFGGDLITVDTACVEVAASGYEDGGVPSEPTPDVYSSLVSLATEAKEIAQSVKTAADNGEFDGKGAKINGYEVLEIRPGNNVNLEVEDGVMTIYTDVVDVSDLVDKVNQKADKTSVYTKSEIDELVGDIEAVLRSL